MVPLLRGHLWFVWSGCSLSTHQHRIHSLLFFHYGFAFGLGGGMHSGVF